MIIIDSHTHIFPDKIAKATIEKLESFSPLARSATDGTLSGLLASMDKGNIDYSVVLPVVTAPKQFDSINSFATRNNHGRLICFGGIHPDCENIPSKVAQIKSLGLYGIKLHPDYQSTYVDDERYIEIVREALKNDLLITFHAGVDIGMPETVHCSPDRAARLLDAVKDLNQGEPRIIFAHFGGHAMADEVMRHLCGRNCMFDTAFTLMHEVPHKLEQIIKSHGAEKILFATDSPWSDQKESVERLCSLSITDQEKNLIIGENAARIFGKLQK